MPEKYSIAQAKNKLTAIVHSVETGPAIQLTRRGKPVAMLLSVKEYERLAGKRKDFYEAMMAFRFLTPDHPQAKQRHTNKNNTGVNSFSSI